MSLFILVKTMSIKLRFKEIKDNRKSLYLDLYVQKKHQYKFLNCFIYSNPRTKEERTHNKEILAYAHSQLSQLQLELYNSNELFFAPAQTKNSIIEYLKELQDSKTTKQSQSNISSLQYHLITSKLFESIDDIHLNSIQKFSQYLQNTVSSNSAKTYFTLFLHFLRFLQGKKLLQNIDLKRVKKISGEETQRTFLSESELQLLSKTDCPNEQVKRAFLFSCLCGLRLSDIKTLSSKNLDWENNCIVLRNKKTSSIQYIPITESMKVFLDSLRNSEILFSLPDTSNVERNLEKWAKKANLGKKLTFHVARHTFATLLLTKNIDIYTISKLLNHKDLKTTQIYASLVDEKKISALNTLPTITI